VLKQIHKEVQSELACVSFNMYLLSTEKAVLKQCQIFIWAKLSSFTPPQYSLR